jgi:hypothetical protein
MALSVTRSGLSTPSHICVPADASPLIAVNCNRQKLKQPLRINGMDRERRQDGGIPAGIRERQAGGTYDGKF